MRESSPHVGPARVVTDRMELRDLVARQPPSLSISRELRAEASAATPVAFRLVVPFIAFKAADRPRSNPGGDFGLNPGGAPADVTAPGERAGAHPAPNRHITHANDIDEFTAKNQTVMGPLFGRRGSRAALLLGSHGDATLLLGKAGRRATGTGRRRYRRSVIVSRSSFDVFRSAERRAGRGISRVRRRSKAGGSKRLEAKVVTSALI